jgi:hypothetical protein
MAVHWKLSGHLIGCCSCDWGCPCSFDAPPTYGFCDGAYVWHVERGRFGSTRLDGLTFAAFGRSPGPVHKGGMTWLPIIERDADPAQRAAIEQLLAGGEGGPWAIFATVTKSRRPAVYAHFTTEINGLATRVRAGRTLNIRLDKIHNPVTGEAEELKLVKPTGFTSKWAELGRSVKFRIAAPDIDYDYSGRYAEYSRFSYSSPR